MNDDLKNLKFEIEILNKRVSILEKKAKRQRIWSLLKLILSIIIIVGVSLYIYSIYQKVVTTIENSPLNSFLNQFDFSQK